MLARKGQRAKKKIYNPAEITYVCIHLSIAPFLLQLVTLLTLIAVILLVISLEHIIDVEDGVDSILTSSPSITNYSTISSSKSISSGAGKSLSEALLFAEHGGEHVVYQNCSECQKQFLYTTCSPQV